MTWKYHTPEREAIVLSEDARKELKYIANSGRLYAPKAAEMLELDNILKEKCNDQ